MRSFVLLKSNLLSLREKKARGISFHPKTTIVRGVNHTGKSSVLKSIYRCFGAEPPLVHDRWKIAQVIGAVTFAVDGVEHTILQNGTRYAIYDANKALVRSFKSVGKELAPYLASLFEFKLKLVTAKNEAQTPPPAFLFFPFYVDQDNSWKENWSSFRGL